MKALVLLLCSFSLAFGQNQEKENDRGVALLNAERYTEALPIFEQLVQTDAENTIFRYNRAVTLLNLRRFPEALRDYEELARALPDESEYPFQIGNIYDHIDSIALSLRYYTTAIHLNRNEYIYYFKRGTSFLKLRQWQKSIDDFDHALALHPYHANSLHNRAIAKFKVGAEQSACDDWFKALTFDHALAKGHLEKNCKKYLSSCPPVHENH